MRFITIAKNIAGRENHAETETSRSLGNCKQFNLLETGDRERVRNGLEMEAEARAHRFWTSTETFGLSLEG